MRKISINIILLLQLAFANAQIEYPGYFEDNQIPINNQPAQVQSNSNSSTSLYSPNGQAFTPKGDLKVLVICAGIGEPFDSYPMGGWAPCCRTIASCGR